MRHRQPSRRIRNLLMFMVAVLTGMGLCATALTPVLATRYPFLLLVLESPVRNLVLTREMAIAPFLAISVMRRVGGALVMYLLGRWYGDEALCWLERRLGHRSGVMCKVNQAVRSAAYPMVFCLPEAIVSVIAGSTGMPPVTFLSVSVAGSLTITLLARLLGYALAKPLNVVLGFLSHHTMATTAVIVTTIGCGFLMQWLRKRSALSVETAGPAL